LTPEQLKPHSAAHTLKFLEDTYVEIDDDATHYTWSDILTATRTPSMTVFAWVYSFTLLTLRYGDTVKRINPIRSTKINKVVSKQITDDEKAIIATLNTSYSSISLNAGQYTITSLVKLLAQNVTSFTKRYTPSEHVRITITKYLRTRAMKYRKYSRWLRKARREKDHQLNDIKSAVKASADGFTSEKPLQPDRPHPLFTPRERVKGKAKAKVRVRAKATSPPPTERKGQRER
jgi:hypothetical protein